MQYNYNSTIGTYLSLQEIERRQLELEREKQELDRQRRELEYRQQLERRERERLVAISYVPRNGYDVDPKLLQDRNWQDRNWRERENAPWGTQEYRHRPVQQDNCQPIGIAINPLGFLQMSVYHTPNNNRAWF